MHTNKGVRYVPYSPLHVIHIHARHRHTTLFLLAEIHNCMILKHLILKVLTKLSKSEVYSESSVREQAGANQGWCESPCLIWVNTHIDSDGIEANCLTMGMVVPWTGADIGAHSCWWDDHSLYTMVWPRHILLWKKNTDFLLLTFYHQFCCLNHHICPHHCITNQPKQRLITFCETYQFSYPRFAEQP
jgi:hypothetical protein